MSLCTFYLDTPSWYGKPVGLKLYKVLYSDLGNYGRKLKIQLEPPPFYEIYI